MKTTERTTTNGLKITTTNLTNDDNIKLYAIREISIYNGTTYIYMLDNSVIIINQRNDITTVEKLQ